MYVIGTAGHVDHGKSTLVRALTGIDPDRLPEEKQRQMTTDIGFAWLTLPSGREVSVVDVPGHERFMKNMLAGIGGIDLALLIVAADEGVAAQTKEHIAVLDLLNLKHAVVVITKIDTVDAETRELAALEAADAIKGTSVEGAPAVFTSSVTGEGMSDLAAAIDRALDNIPAPKNIDRPRLSIDRVFSVKGFGTVVTGTLLGGRLFVNQEVEIMPVAKRAHIRGLQTHKQKLDAAGPGTRVAVNLAGADTGELERGQVLTVPGWLKPTSRVDVRLRIVSGLSGRVAHNDVVTFHTGACEVAGKLRLLEKESLKGGESGWGQLLFQSPVAVAKGDLFILRSPELTIGGGEIVNPYARRHRLFSPATIANLEVAEDHSPVESLLSIIKNRQPAEFENILRLSNLSPDEVKTTLEQMVSENRAVMTGADYAHAVFFTAEGWKGLVEKAVSYAQEYYRQYLMGKGVPKEEIRSRLDIPLRHFNGVVRKLVEGKIFTEDGASLKLTSFEVPLSGRQKAAADAYIQALSRHPYQPLAAAMPEPQIVNKLITERRIVMIGGNFVLLRSAYEEMTVRILERVRQNGKVTVAEARDMLKTGRDIIVTLLEYLDEQEITRRADYAHVLFRRENFLRTIDSGSVDKIIADAFLHDLAENPYAPSVTAVPEPAIVSALVNERRIVRMGDNVILLTTACEKMVQGIVERLRANGKVTVAEVRDMFGSSRRIALAILEYLDEQEVTRRDGDAHVLSHDDSRGAAGKTKDEAAKVK